MKKAHKLHSHSSNFFLLGLVLNITIILCHTKGKTRLFSLLDGNSLWTEPAEILTSFSKGLCMSLFQASSLLIAALFLWYFIFFPFFFFYPVRKPIQLRIEMSSCHLRASSNNNGAHIFCFTEDNTEKINIFCLFSLTKSKATCKIKHLISAVINSVLWGSWKNISVGKYREMELASPHWNNQRKIMIVSGLLCELAAWLPLTPEQKQLYSYVGRCRHTS